MESCVKSTRTSMEPRPANGLQEAPVAPHVSPGVQTSRRRLPGNVVDAMAALAAPWRPDLSPERLLRKINQPDPQETLKHENAPLLPGRLFTIAHTAELLSMCPKSVQNLLKSGRLTRVKLSRKMIRIREADVLRLVTEVKGEEQHD